MRTLDRVACIVAAAALATLAALPARAQPAGIDPKATAILKASTTYVAGLKRFTVDTRSDLEVVLTSGQRIEFGQLARMKVERPNRFRAERIGDLVAQEFIYDGKTLSLNDPVGRVFATVPAPATIEATLDFARTKLDIIAPAGDLVYADAYDILMKGVTSGFVVGEGFVDGVLCTHLAFRAPQTDWQIWIEAGKRPGPAPARHPLARGAGRAVVLRDDEQVGCRAEVLARHVRVLAAEGGAGRRVHRRRRSDRALGATT